ncbi:MAG: DUF5615 family PIN-like protein [Pseudanabaenaceae cyanobacterium]
MQQIGNKKQSKVIWIRRGNCSTNDIEQILRSAYTNIQDFFQNVSTGIMMLY